MMITATTLFGTLLVNQRPVNGLSFSPCLSWPTPPSAERSNAGSARSMVGRSHSSGTLVSAGRCGTIPAAHRALIRSRRFGKQDPGDDEKAATSDADDGKERTRTDDPPADSYIPPFPAAALVATILFASFWPLLAFLRATNSPLDGFDVDTFMALRGILDNNDAVGMGSDTVMEFPPLCPAERLVDAIFGPP